MLEPMAARDGGMTLERRVMARMIASQRENLGLQRKFQRQDQGKQIKGKERKVTLSKDPQVVASREKATMLVGKEKVKLLILNEVATTVDALDIWPRIVGW